VRDSVARQDFRLIVFLFGLYRLSMPRDGAITLSDVSQPTIELICEACGRRGRYNVARLIAKYGDAKLPTLAAQLADCPKERSASIYDRCKIRWARWE
jgi:hypothetical protein